MDKKSFSEADIRTKFIEAKDNMHSVGAGMQQALEYAEILDVPFAYSSNGDAFLEHDRTEKGGAVEREIPLDQFPSPEDLWARYQAARGLQRSAAIDHHAGLLRRRHRQDTALLSAAVLDRLEEQLNASREAAASLLYALVAEITGKN